MKITFYFMYKYTITITNLKSKQIESFFKRITIINALVLSKSRVKFLAP